MWRQACCVHVLSRNVSQVEVSGYGDGCIGEAVRAPAVNHLDIAPKHASIVTGLSNTFGTVAGIVGVTLTGWLLQLSGGAGMGFGWACSFGISAAFMVAGNAVFLRYSRGEVLLS